MIPCTRRGTPLTAAALLAAALIAATPLATDAQEVFELDSLAPGVWAAHVLPRPAAYAFANALVVIGEDGVLVVDTRQSLTAARALIAHIEALTTKPVRWVVNTHWHGDHVNGNQAYRDAFPGVQFIAHTTLRDDLATLGRKQRLDELAELPASIEQRRQWLRNGVGPDGTQLSDDDRRAVQRSHDLRAAYLNELRIIDPPLPSITIEQQATIDVGGRSVQLIHVGPAHTRGDLLVYLPASGIVAVGDLLEAGMPYFEHASPAGWLKAARTIEALDPKLIVPAHGRVMRERDLLHHTIELLSAIDAAAANGAVAPDESPAWAALRMKWLDTWGVSADAFDAGIRTALARAQSERESK